MVDSALSRLKLTSRDVENLTEIASEIVSFARDKKFWIFRGDMGTGKTTLIKSIAEVMGVIDVVSSPTYSLVNEYLTKMGQPFYHFDFYRLNDEEEALDIGIEEYFDSGNFCFVEWPSKVASLLPSDNYLTIDIELGDNNQRVIELIHHD